MIKKGYALVYSVKIRIPTDEEIAERVQTSALRVCDDRRESTENKGGNVFVARLLDEAENKSRK